MAELHEQEINAASPDELVREMTAWQKKGYLTLVKWTCPKCGDRVTSGEPNVFHAMGYYHDVPGCGALYTGPAYGFSAISVPGMDGAALAAMIQRSYETLPTFEGDLPGLRDGGTS